MAQIEPKLVQIDPNRHKSNPNWNKLTQIDPNRTPIDPKGAQSSPGSPQTRSEAPFWGKKGENREKAAEEEDWRGKRRLLGVINQLMTPRGRDRSTPQLTAALMSFPFPPRGFGAKSGDFGVKSGDFGTHRGRNGAGGTGSERGGNGAGGTPPEVRGETLKWQKKGIWPQSRALKTLPRRAFPFLMPNRLFSGSCL